MMWGLIVPRLSQKWLISNNLCRCLSQKVGFFLIFELILRAGFSDIMLALSNKKSTFVLVSDFLAVVFHNFVQILYERSVVN